MKTIDLFANEIITLNDYPVYNNEVLCKYFFKCNLGEEIPFVPVIKKEILKKYFNQKLLEELRKFEILNPVAEYFMLDGSHRTTALNLLNVKIKAIVYETNLDIIEAKKLILTNKVLKNGILDKTFMENCEILKKHFENKPYFMTVKEKTEKMRQEKVLPLKITEFLEK